MNRAVDAYRNEARFHAVAQSIVARSVADYGEIDPERTRQAAHEIALQATVLLLQTIYEDDAELRALREELAMVRKNFLSYAEKTPARPLFVLPETAQPVA